MPNSELVLDNHLELPNGFRIPSVGLGTYTGNSDEITDDAVKVAIEAGYRHLDTAYLYANEAIIGRSLKKVFDDGTVKRENMFIVSKLPQTNLRAEEVEIYLRKSLASLQLEYLDMYLVHWPCGLVDLGNDNFYPVDEDGNVLIDPTTDIVGLWKKMEDMVDKGLTKFIGLSNFNIDQIERIMVAARIKPVNLQAECHAYFQQKELFDFCRKHGITFTAYAPLASPGIATVIESFTGKMVELPPLLDDPHLKEIAKHHKKSVSQILLRWLIQRGIIVIPKSTNPERIKANIDIFDFRLTRADTKAIESLDRGFRIFNLEFMQGIKLHPEYPF